MISVAELMLLIFSDCCCFMFPFLQLQFNPFKAKQPPEGIGLQGKENKSKKFIYKKLIRTSFKKKGAY